MKSNAKVSEKRRQILPTDKVRVYTICMDCGQTWGYEFKIEDGIAPKTAIAPAKCQKCIDNLTHQIEENLRKQLGLPPGADLPPIYL